ncbi:hypothetical protein DIPPA_22725 [Diplonema papillatum]|nr:hypothetical protein DIPPA_22725 [Diplonema papillatum]
MHNLSMLAEVSAETGTAVPSLSALQESTGKLHIAADDVTAEIPKQLVPMRRGQSGECRSPEESPIVRSVRGSIKPGGCDVAADKRPCLDKPLCLHPEVVEAVQRGEIDLKKSACRRYSQADSAAFNSTWPRSSFSRDRSPSPRMLFVGQRKSLTARSKSIITNPAGSFMRRRASLPLPRAKQEAACWNSTGMESSFMPDVPWTKERRLSKSNTARNLPAARHASPRRPSSYYRRTSACFDSTDSPRSPSRPATDTVSPYPTNTRRLSKAMTASWAPEGRRASHNPTSYGGDLWAAKNRSAASTVQARPVQKKNSGFNRMPSPGRKLSGLPPQSPVLNLRSCTRLGSSAKTPRRLSPRSS